MLHRLSLRVLPQLHLLVTDQPVRKRKRLVMLAPGLVAFGIYRLLKDVLPLSEPLVLLGLSGWVSALAAIWAYRQGRGLSLQESFRQDGLRQWAWIVGWIGVAYGMQLSLLVLAILQVFVGYDFLLHPESKSPTICMLAARMPSFSGTRWPAAASAVAAGPIRVPPATAMAPTVAVLRRSRRVKLLCLCI